MSPIAELLPHLLASQEPKRHRLQTLQARLFGVSGLLPADLVRGSVAGVDQLFSTVITTTANGATVARLQRQVCVAGAFGPPSVYDTGGWNVGLGKGMSGSAVVESSIPLSMLPLTGSMKAVVVTNDGSGGQDATATFAITLSPSVGPTGLGTPIMVPLAPWLVPSIMEHSKITRSRTSVLGRLSAPRMT